MFYLLSGHLYLLNILNKFFDALVIEQECVYYAEGLFWETIWTLSKPGFYHEFAFQIMGHEPQEKNPKANAVKDT